MSPSSWRFLRNRWNSDWYLSNRRQARLLETGQQGPAGTVRGERSTEPDPLEAAAMLGEIRLLKKAILQVGLSRDLRLSFVLVRRRWVHSPDTLRSLGKQLGISSERVRQLEVEAIRLTGEILRK